MRYYVFSILAAGLIIVGYSNCGQVGESNLSTANSLQEGDPARGTTVYNVDGNLAACVTCHGVNGTSVVGVDLKTFSDEDIERSVRTGPGSMPIYSDSDITAQQLIDVIAYIRIL